jgi:hypothetical protein
MAAQKLSKMITDRRTVQRTKKNRDLTADVGSQAKILDLTGRTQDPTQISDQRAEQQTKPTGDSTRTPQIQKQHITSTKQTANQIFFIEI